VGWPLRCLNLLAARLAIHPVLFLPITLESTTHIYHQVLVFDTVGFHEESE